MRGITLSIIFILIGHLAAAQVYGAWKFGGLGDDEAKSVIQTADNGFVVVGNTASYGKGMSDIFVIKYDVNFQVEWKKSIGGVETDVAAAIVQTNDGGYIIGGGTGSFCATPGAESDIYFVKLSATGVIEWTRVVANSPGANSWENLLTMRKVADGTVLASGILASGGTSTSIVLRLDQTGAILSSGIMSESWAMWNDIVSIYPTSDGGFATMGTSSASPIHYGINLVKVNSTNTVDWGMIHSAYEAPLVAYYEYVSADMIQSGDGGYVVTGLLSEDEIYFSLSLSKFSNTGLPLWVKYQKNQQLQDTLLSSQGTKVIQTSDGGYAVVGTCRNIYMFQSNIILNRYDSNGDIIWSKIIGDAYDEEWPSDLIQSSDGGFVIAGTKSDSINLRDFYIIKTDQNGNTCQSSINFGITQHTLSPYSQNSGSYIAAGVYTLTGAQVDSVGITTEVCTTASPLQVSMSGLLFCNGVCDGFMFADINGGMSPYTYLWSNGSTTNGLNNACIGQYTVQVNDALGNSQTASYYLSAEDSVAFLVNTTPATCNSSGDGTATLTVTSGMPGYDYYWQTGGSGITETGISSGTYSVMVEDSYGCPLTKTFSIGESQPIVLVTSTINASCGMCANGSATVTASGGIGSPYQYQWFPSGCNSDVCNNLTPGNYTVCVTDAGNCQTCMIVNIDFSTGVSFNKINGFSVFPNPFSEITTFIFPVDMTFDECNIELYDVLGKKVKSYSLINEHQFTLSRHELENGIYFYKIFNSHEIKVSGKLLIE